MSRMATSEYIGARRRAYANAPLQVTASSWHQKDGESKRLLLEMPTWGTSRAEGNGVTCATQGVGMRILKG